MKVNLLLIFVFVSTLTAFSQEKQTFVVGINVGGKFANRYYAGRYTGAYQDELPTLLSQQQIHQDIYLVLGNKDFSFSDYNQNFRYNPAFNFGFVVGYNVSPNFQASIDANFSKLKVNTSYTLEILDPLNFTSQEQYMTGYIIGQEGRFNGRFNLDYISDGEKTKFIIGASGLFTSWRMEQLIAEVNNEAYLLSLYSIHDPNNNFTKKTSGSGWGYGINIGVEYKLNDQFTLQAMYQPYFSKSEYFVTKSQKENNLSLYQKPKNRLEHDITLRILWK